MKSSHDQIIHDIKSLIMSIKAYVQLTGRTLKDTKETKAVDYLKRADMQIDKLTSLIKKLKFKSQK